MADFCLYFYTTFFVCFPIQKDQFSLSFIEEKDIDIVIILTRCLAIAETALQGALVLAKSTWKTGTVRQYVTDIIDIFNHYDIIAMQSYRIW